MHPKQVMAQQLVLGCICTWAKGAVSGGMPYRWPFALIIFLMIFFSLVIHDDPSQEL